MSSKSRLIVGFSVVVILGIAALLSQSNSTKSQVFAQETCPAEMGCPKLVLRPETLVGDFFLNDALLAAGQNTALVQVPPAQAHLIVVRNIIDTTAGFGELFIYEEASVNVNVRAGQIRQFNVSPRKTFIRGTLKFTCTIANVKEGENVACQVLVDGVHRADVPLNEQAEFIVDTGERALQVNLIGANVDLWSPTSWQSTINITAGRTTNARSQFTKRAHLIVVLNQAGAVGDIYLNDALIAAQVPSIDLWVDGNASYNIAVRNINDPAGAGVYRWLDATTSTNLRAGQERTVMVRLRKELLPTPPPPAGAVPGAAASCTDGSFDFAVCSQYQPAPANCDEAVARGIPERAAACCFPSRDRDKDGVACYGN